MMILVYLMSGAISAIFMCLALTIRAYKADPTQPLPRKEVSFIFGMLIGCFIPVLNIIASIYYLYKVIAQ